MLFRSKASGVMSLEIQIDWTGLGYPSSGRKHDQTKYEASPSWSTVPSILHRQKDTIRSTHPHASSSMAGLPYGPAGYTSQRMPAHSIEVLTFEVPVKT